MTDKRTPARKARRGPTAVVVARALLASALQLAGAAVLVVAGFAVHRVLGLAALGLAFLGVGLLLDLPVRTVRSPSKER